LILTSSFVSGALDSIGKGASITVEFGTTLSNFGLDASIIVEFGTTLSNFGLNGSTSTVFFL
jgi:hypothetical protein